jgi:2-hydroxy-3-oxopropionate reductase
VLEGRLKVGFIGLGDMGLPMAERVVKAGFPLTTMAHRRKERAGQLAALGAEVVKTPAEVADRSDVLITILPADAELEQVIYGSGGVLQSSLDGKVLVDMTTATATTLLKIEESVRGGSGHSHDYGGR